MKDILEKNVTLLVSGVIAFYLLLRVMAVAEWDSTTAPALLQYSGTGNVAITGVITGVKSLLPLVIVLAIPRVERVFESMTKVERSAAKLALGPILLILVLSVPALVLLVYYFAFSGIPKLVRWSRVRRSRKKNKGKRQAHSLEDKSSEGMSWLERRMVLWAVYGFALFFTLGAPWTPSERVELESGEIVVAHVLSATSTKTVVLLSDDRKVELLETSRIARQICSDFVWTSSTLRELTFEPRYPACS